MLKYVINKEFKPSIKFEPFTKINKQNAVKNKLKYEFFKRLSKKTILDDAISKFKKKTLKKIIIVCNINLNAGDIRIFLSEKKPTKKIKHSMKFKIG